MRTQLFHPSLGNVEGATRGLPPERMTAYAGVVSHANNEKVLHAMRQRIAASDAELHLLVTSTGGPTGTAMSFFDALRLMQRPRLTTIGSGDVDSSGIIIFLSGDVRLLSPRTTLLLHRAGRRFEPEQRFTAAELEAMAREDRLKDEQYASTLASRAHSLSQRDVLAMMRDETVLSPEEAVRMGIAHALL